jgi:hypothetical protein
MAPIPEVAEAIDRVLAGSGNPAQNPDSGKENAERRLTSAQ